MKANKHCHGDLLVINNIIESPDNFINQWTDNVNISYFEVFLFANIENRLAGLKFFNLN
jgi:hypothetical protein